MVPNTFTRSLGVKYPLIVAPMFLASNPELVEASIKQGAVGAVPSLNWRTTDEFDAGIGKILENTKGAPGKLCVNLIVNQINPRYKADLEVCVKHKVPLIITSLGNPKDVITAMHAVGSKVFCDVVGLEHSKKVEDLGADGVIAVSSGAGGHAGPISPMVLLPYLKKHLKIPVVAAGGISTGDQVLAAMTLGANAVQLGTLFIASAECSVDQRYKDAILNADPEDIWLTKKVSGTNLSVIKTPYIESQGTELSWVETSLTRNPRFKKYIKMARAYLGTESLRTAVLGPTYKEVWSAGQGVGLIDNVKTVAEIIATLESEFKEALKRVSTLEKENSGNI